MNFKWIFGGVDCLRYKSARITRVFTKTLTKLDKLNKQMQKAIDDRAIEVMKIEAEIDLLNNEKERNAKLNNNIKKLFE